MELVGEGGREHLQAERSKINSCNCTAQTAVFD